MITFTPASLFAEILAVCAGISCIATAIGWVIKVIKVARAPSQKVDERLTALEKTIEDYHFHIYSISLMPSIRFTYLHKPMVRLYSGLDAGVCLFWENNPKSENSSNTVIPAFNLTPLGLQVGRTWYGMLEVNFWSDAIVKAGVGYRFN